MRLGFLDCVSNVADVWPAAQKVFDNKLAGTTIVRLTAPDLLKVPVAAKKLLQDQGADAVLVFLTVAREDKDALFLVYEKMIDVELSTNRYVFFAVLEEREWPRPKEVPPIAIDRLEAASELIGIAQQQSEVAGSIGSGLQEATGELSVFSMFAQESEKGGGLF